MKIDLFSLSLILIFAINAKSVILKDTPLQSTSLQNSTASYTSPLDSTALDSFIVKTMQDYHMVGLATCVIKDGQMRWHHNYGYANLEKNIPVTDSTLFMLASISKTFVTTAIMQLWEKG